MFVYTYTHVAAPVEEVEEQVLALLGRLEAWAASAYRDGEELRMKIGVAGSRLAAKAVRVRVGSPQQKAEGTTIPLTWDATGIPGLFPTMEADLVVAAVGPEMTQVALRGMYTPPLGALGRVLDRALLHRLAEASVKRFVDSIAGELERPGVPDAEASQREAR